MSRQAKAKHRAIRIELLRARADLERRTLCQQSQNLAEDLQPRNLLNSLTPAFSARNMGNWVSNAVRLSRRYPFLLSSASSVLSLFGGRWVKFATVGIVGWRLFSNYQDRSQQRSAESVRHPESRDY